jgi:16S rRNA U516 pseudouridylate synthase RsuA-like enzyme
MVCNVADRFDADSRGLRLLADDDAVQVRNAGPHFKMEKAYWEQVEGMPEELTLPALCSGVHLNEGSRLTANPPTPARFPPSEQPWRSGCVNRGAICRR